MERKNICFCSKTQLRILLLFALLPVFTFFKGMEMPLDGDHAYDFTDSTFVKNPHVFVTKGTTVVEIKETPHVSKKFTGIKKTIAKEKAVKVIHNSQKHNFSQKIALVKILSNSSQNVLLANGLFFAKAVITSVDRNNSINKHIILNIGNQSIVLITKIVYTYSFYEHSYQNLILRKGISIRPPPISLS